MSDPDAPNTRTKWGEIAYQLYGLDGYEYLKEYGQDRTAPDGNTLKGLFDLGEGPALILVDEIAAYLESASAVVVGDATLASPTLNFILSLLETTSEVGDVTVVYSIADTAFEE
jgi:predicted AAA+ superfamily ATPase